MSKTLLGGKWGLMSCISWFNRPIKPIRGKYIILTKTHRVENLVLIAEDEKKIQRNSGESIVYTISYADFEGVDFYIARKYIHLKTEVIEEDFSVSDEEK